MVAACGEAKPESPKTTIGHHVTHLTVSIGGTWGHGYAVDVVPNNYAVVEHVACPEAKRPEVPTDDADGLCIVRITKDQSKRFEAAMDRFERYAKPLQNFSFEDPWTRPNGKPCKSQVTDATIISMEWTGTQGAKIATFYTGCDPEELAAFYNSALAVTDSLPIQQIIGKH
jgi:hypothetical protein